MGIIKDLKSDYKHFKIDVINLFRKAENKMPHVEYDPDAQNKRNPPWANPLYLPSPRAKKANEDLTMTVSIKIHKK